MPPTRHQPDSWCRIHWHTAMHFFREHLIGHDHICGIHRSLVGGFAPDLCLDVLVLLLVGHGMDALDKRNGEVELAALDGGLLNLAEAGLHARVAGWDDGHRLEQQEGHEDDSEQENTRCFFILKISLHNNVGSRAEALPRFISPEDQSPQSPHWMPLPAAHRPSRTTCCRHRRWCWCRSWP